jgi:hemerythrin HHE cation binding domain-containing protein
VTEFEAEHPETAQGHAMFQELLYIHGAIRHDLQVVERLATGVLDGLPPGQLQAEIRDLQTNGPLWQLKVNCLRYCRFVHLHHHMEDVAFFPRLRATNPAIAPVVDKLEADHRRVSDLLDEVEAAAAALDADDCEASRRRVADALGTLALSLLEHLDFEERSAGPTIRRMTGF